MQLSVIIVSYNVKPLLLQTIKSVYETAGCMATEVIVVDNNSTDRTVEAIRKEFPGVKLIENKSNVGFSRANNQGGAVACGGKILFLNPDTVVQPGALADLLKFMDVHPRCGIAGPALLDGNGGFQKNGWTGFSVRTIFFDMTYLSRLFPKSKIFNGHEYGGQGLDTEREVGYVSGAALLIDRELFNKLEGFDEDLFWTEDVDLCVRANTIGWEIWYVGTARITHHGGESAKKNIRVVLINQYLSKLKYFAKHGTQFQLFLLRLLFSTEVILKIFVRSTGMLVGYPKDVVERLRAYKTILKAAVTGRYIGQFLS